MSEPPGGGSPTTSDGAYVEEELDLSDFERDRPSIEEGPAKPVEYTRAQLAYLMLGLLALVMIGMLALLGTKRITADEFSTIAGVLVAPIVGLLGAATGYYYGRGGK